MNTQQPKFHEWFHNFLIYFALWILPAYLAWDKYNHITECKENGFEGKELTLTVIVDVMFIAVGIFIIIARFDLAAFRKKAPKELLIAFLLLALFCFVNLWRINYIDNGEPDKNNILTAIVFACWGIVLFRYYHDRGYLFEEQRNIQNIENIQKTGNKPA